MTVTASGTDSTTDRLWRAFLLAAVALMAVAALYRVPTELWRLAFEPLGHGASTDLKKRFIEVHEWFAGRPVYGVVESADYPPASYPVLFPLVHWPTLAATRLVWTASTIAALAWLTVLCVRESGAQDRTAKAFAALLPLACYATAANIRIGQMGVHLLPLLVAGVLRLARAERSWGRDAAAAALLVVALVKPTFSVPFFWIAFFRGGWRATVLICGGYAALTLLGAAFQHGDLPSLIHGWLGQSGNVEFDTAHANLFTWMAALGLQRFILPASLLVLLVAGGWTWWRRDADPWGLLAVAAIVARVWSYHRWYDDILMLLPVLALLRMIAAQGASGRSDRAAMVLVALLWGFAILPAQLFAGRVPLSGAIKAAKTTVWMATFAVLLVRTGRRVRA